MRNIKDYFKPTTIHDAVTLIREHPGKGKFLAGGSQITGENDPSLDYLVDLTSCDLNWIQEKNDYLSLGSCVTLEELAASDLLNQFAQGVIAEVARWTGSVQLRNSGTLGGSLITKADIALPLLALDAQLVVVGETEHQISLAEFYQSAVPVLREGELIKEVLIPLEYRQASGKALRQSRTRQDVSIVAVIALMLRDDQQCRKARLVIAPVETGMTRVPDVEALFEGKSVTEELLDQAAAALVQRSDIVDDFRASAHYRRQLISIYAKRAFAAC